MLDVHKILGLFVPTYLPTTKGTYISLQKCVPCNRRVESGIRLLR